MEDKYEAPDLSQFSEKDLVYMMLASGMVDDMDFVKACRDELSKRKPEPKVTV